MPLGSISATSICMDYNWMLIGLPACHIYLVLFKYSSYTHTVKAFVSCLHDESA